MSTHAGFCNWKTTSKALHQALRGCPQAERIERVMSILPHCIELCGEGSRHRRMVLKIARALSEEHPAIFAPCCPDYGHNGNTYTFQGVGRGVSLLAECHIEFLEHVSRLVPEAHITLLLADQEADDEEIVHAIGVDRTSFLDCIRGSLERMRERVQALGWDVRYMTEAIPELRAAEAAFAQKLMGRDTEQGRLRSDMLARIPLYQRINPLMSTTEMLRRTARTAAQYVALGEAIARTHGIVCNHTTTNLSWYGETNVAVLHNPISVY